MSDPSLIDAIERQIRRQDVRGKTTFLVAYRDIDDLMHDHAGTVTTGRTFLPVLGGCAAGDAISLVLSCPGLLQPLRLDGTVTAFVRKKRKTLGLDIALLDSAKQLLAEQFQRIEQRDPAYVVRAIRVLVVEDNPHYAKLIQDGLHLAAKRAFSNQVAFDVPLAATAADGVAFLRKKPIDVLIADIYLSGGTSGATVIEHVRASTALRAVPVIAISAGHDEATREVAVAAGADMFLEKPLRLKQIISAVGKVLELEPSDWLNKQES